MNPALRIYYGWEILSMNSGWPWHGSIRLPRDFNSAHRYYLKADNAGFTIANGRAYDAVCAHDTR